MDLTFELIGKIAVWMFISEIILLIIFKKSGKQFKFRIKELTHNLNPYIKKWVYIIIALITFLVVGVIQNVTNFVDNFLINFIGNPFLLYLIAFSFDVGFISHELAGLNLKNNLVKYPFIISGIFFLIAMILKYLVK